MHHREPCAADMERQLEIPVIPQGALMARRTFGLALALTLIACGVTGGPRRGSSDILTREEISTSSASTAYEVLQQLRPRFLRSRGVTSIQNPVPAYPVVYMNDIHHGDLDTLRTIRVDEIDEIRYISAADATTRWGTGHGGGVIQIRASY
jgi:hypothetical protein